MKVPVVVLVYNIIILMFIDRYEMPNKIVFIILHICFHIAKKEKKLESP